MTKKLVVACASALVVVILVIVAGAASVTMSLAAFSSSSQSHSCTRSVVASPSGGTVPAQLAVTNSKGEILTLGAKQLQNASQMIATARSMNVSDKGLTVMVITALQESKFWMYANSGVPESLVYPHDKVGADHDSVNPFQQRANWGSVQQRMDLAYATEAFFGGPAGPNGGSPRGLFDIPGWEDMEPGDAAQAVQVSAFPDAYAQWLPAAQTILDTVSGAAGGSCTGGGAASGAAVLPLTTPLTMTDDFGPRTAPTAGASSWHPAVDRHNSPNPCGQPVYAVMEGTVTESSRLYLSVKHPDGFVISYLHTHKSERLVDVGAKVTAGQQIAVVGNEAPSTGCHLDLRINVKDNTNPQVAALPVDADNAPGWVNPEDFLAIFGVTLCPTDWSKRTY